MDFCFENKKNYSKSRSFEQFLLWFGLPIQVSLHNLDSIAQEMSFNCQEVNLFSFPDLLMDTDLIHKIKMAQCGIVVVSSFTYKIQKCPRTQCTFIRQTLARVGSFGISRLEIRCSMFSSDKPLTFNTLVHFSTLWYISGTPYHTLVHSGTI